MNPLIFALLFSASDSVVTDSVTNDLTRTPHFAFGLALGGGHAVFNDNATTYSGPHYRYGAWFTAPLSSKPRHVYVTGSFGFGYQRGVASQGIVNTYILQPPDQNEEPLDTTFIEETTVGMHTLDATLGLGYRTGGLEIGASIFVCRVTSGQYKETLTDDAPDIEGMPSTDFDVLHEWYGPGQIMTENDGKTLVAGMSGTGLFTEYPYGIQLAARYGSDRGPFRVELGPYFRYYVSEVHAHVYSLWEIAIELRVGIR